MRKQAEQLACEVSALPYSDALHKASEALKLSIVELVHEWDFEVEWQKEGVCRDRQDVRSEACLITCSQTLQSLDFIQSVKHSALLVLRSLHSSPSVTHSVHEVLRRADCLAQVMEG